MALSVALPPVASGCSVGVSRGARLDDDVFGSLALLLGSSHASPSPSSSSESSGIGSLGSLKSDSLPSSPHSVDKKLFDEEPPLALPKPKQAKEEPVHYAPVVRISYQGRNLLDLVHNVRGGRWQYRPAYLPPNNPAVFFENRSQYHRLGSVAPPEFITDKCPKCSFESVIAVVD